MRFYVVKIENYIRHEIIPEAVIEITADGVSVKDETEWFLSEITPHIENPLMSPLVGDEVDATENWEGWLDGLYYLCNEEVKFIAR